MGKPGSSTQQTLEFVERYQLLFNQDPKSRVFAPLAEGYRKLGFLKQAQDIARKGVQLHPSFASGHLALARVLLDLNETEGAAASLEKAVELSPENLLAHRLLAQAQMEQGKPKEALKAFKMLLFLNPRDEVAAAQVKKLESLTAEDFGEDVFRLSPISQFGGSAAKPQQPQPQSLQPRVGMTAYERQRHLERTISLADALLVRSDFERAIQLLENAQQVIGPHPELTRRSRFILTRGPEVSESPAIEPVSTTPTPPHGEEWHAKQHSASTTSREEELRKIVREDPVIQKATRVSRQIEKLENWLQRIEARSKAGITIDSATHPITS